MVSNHKKHHLNKNNSCNLRAIPDKNILESRFPLHFISKIELGQWSFYNFCVSILFVAKLLYSKDFLFFSSLEVFSFCENCYHYYTTSLNEAWTKALLCAGSNPTSGVQEIYVGENLWQRSWLQIRVNAFCRSTIPQKQFIIIIIILYFRVFHSHNYFTDFFLIFRVFCYRNYFIMRFSLFSFFFFFSNQNGIA